MSIAVKCFPLPGVQNYTAADFQAFLGKRTAGVAALGDNLLVSPSAVPDMGLRVSPGNAWLLTGVNLGVSFPVTALKVLTVEPSDAVNSRVDSVVCGINKATNAGYLSVVKGDWGGVAPAPVRAGDYYEIVLAHISVPANTAAITSGLITDKRADLAICGVWIDGGGVVNDLVSEGAGGALGAALGRFAEGPLSALPAVPATCAFYLDTDNRQMMVYSKILGEWFPI